MQLISPAPCCDPCCPTTAINITELIEDLIETDCQCKFVAKDTVAAMRTITEYDTDWYFVTFGGDTVDDGYGKSWRYDAASLAVDDGTGQTVVIRPTNKPVGTAGRLLQTL